MSPKDLVGAGSLSTPSFEPLNWSAISLSQASGLMSECHNG